MLNQIQNNHYDKSISSYLGTEFSIQTFSNIDLKNLGDSLKKKIIECYMKVWDEALTEIYSYNEALDNINNLLSFGSDEKSKVILELAVVFKNDMVIGFCGFEFNDISFHNKQMQSSCEKLKDALFNGFQSVDFWLDKVLGMKTYITLRTTVILKAYRKGFSPFFINAVYPSKIMEYAFTVTYVKHNLSSLNWMLGGGMYPLYICPKSQIIFLGGSSKKILNIAQSYIQNINTPEKDSDMKSNLEAIYCK